MAVPRHPGPAAADPLYGVPVIAPGVTVAGIGAALAAPLDAPAGRGWRVAAAASLAVSLAGLGLHAGAASDTRLTRALDAAVAGWWAGLGSGCLAISGLLLLAGVAWRCGIGRAAQTAALFCAGLGAALSALHPLPGHPIALAGLLATSLGLWAAALLPDLAVPGDAATGPPGRFPGLRVRLSRAASAGWRGAVLQWLVWERACRGLALLGILAALALQTDLALAAAGADRHDTLLPVTRLVGAVLAGAGLTAALAAGMARTPRLGGLVTDRHLDILGRLILALGLAGLYCHGTAGFVALLHGDAGERARAMERLTGGEASLFWTLILAGLLPTQLFWIGAARRSAAALGLTGTLVAVGSFAGQVPDLGGGLPSEGRVEWAAIEAFRAGCADVAGSAGLFALGLLAVFRLVPPVSIAETRGLALARNPRAAQRSPDPPAASGGGPGLTARFASEAELVAALRSLTLPEGAARLDAFGPVPMPEAAAILRRDERALRRLALAGAGLGAAGYLAARAVGWIGAPPVGLHGGDGLAWARLAVPALSAAAIGGTLGIAAALTRHLRAAPASRNAPPAAPDANFVLTLVPASAAFDAEGFARRLRALPEAGGRPLRLDGPGAEPRR